jgi:hypothetical protein
MAPLAIGFNKMLLVQADWRDRYARVFEDRDEYRRYIPRQPYSLKVVEVCGYPTYTFYVHSSRSERSLATRLHRLNLEYPSLKTGPAGAVLRGVRGVGRALGLTR